MTSRTLTQIQDEAALWVYELVTADRFTDTLRQLEGWLEASPQHRTEYSAYTKLWEGLREIQREIRKEAARWVIEIENADDGNGEIPSDMLKSFEDWARHPAHRVEFLRLRRSWESLGALGKANDAV